MTSTPIPPTSASPGLDPRFVDTLADPGYEEPIQVQAGAIPTLLEGR